MTGRIQELGERSEKNPPSQSLRRGEAPGIYGAYFRRAGKADGRAGVSDRGRFRARARLYASPA